ncbi:SMC domain protein [Rutstroemia sp. NJR-2017a BBW]|nr:SMC domain protein [Rutstroemia sp. NJR-2017a BBW]
MSAFSRGLFNLQAQSLRANSSRTFLFSPRSCSHVQLNSRFFTSSSILRAAKKPLPKPKASSKLPPTKLTITQAPPVLKPATYQSYVDALALKSRSTLLYEAPSHNGFVIGSYLGGSFCLAFGALTFWNSYLNAPADIPTWVPVAFGTTCFFLAICGGYLFLAPNGLVRSITAIPTPLLRPSPPTATATAPLHLQITLRRAFPIPFMPPRILTVVPSACTLTSHIYHYLTPAEQRRAELLHKQKMAEMAEYDRTRIIGRGVRHASQGIFELVRVMGRCWTGEGLVKMKVEGTRASGGDRTLKIDGQMGWALDAGRGLERVVKVVESL